MWEEIENLAFKLDRAGIFLNVAGNFMPVSLLLMKDTGIYLLSLQCIFSLIGIIRIFYFNRSVWWEPLVVGGIALFFISEMWKVQSKYEFWMTMSSYIASLIGGVFTALRIDWPSSKPQVWGYHENFHLCVSIAGVIVYLINYSQAERATYIVWDLI
jgi:hemolysin III